MKKVLTAILVISFMFLSSNCFAASDDKYKDEVDNYTSQDDDVPFEGDAYGGIDFGDNDEMAIRAAGEDDGTGEFD